MPLEPLDTGTARRAVEEQLLLDTYLRRQRELEESGALPVARGPLEAHREKLLLAGALELGFLVASFSMLAVLVVVNLIFHLEL